jgi:hypothetical protein
MSKFLLSYPKSSDYDPTPEDDDGLPCVVLKKSNNNYKYALGLQELTDKFREMDWKFGYPVFCEHYWKDVEFFPLPADAAPDAKPEVKSMESRERYWHRAHVVLTFASGDFYVSPRSAQAASWDNLFQGLTTLTLNIEEEEDGLTGSPEFALPATLERIVLKGHAHLADWHRAINAHALVVAADPTRMRLQVDIGEVEGSVLTGDAEDGSLLDARDALKIWMDIPVATLRICCCVRGLWAAPSDAAGVIEGMPRSNGLANAAEVQIVDDSDPPLEEDDTEEDQKCRTLLLYYLSTWAAPKAHRITVEREDFKGGVVTAFSDDLRSRKRSAVAMFAVMRAFYKANAGNGWIESIKDIWFGSPEFKEFNAKSSSLYLNGLQQKFTDRMAGVFTARKLAAPAAAVCHKRKLA